MNRVVLLRRRLAVLVGLGVVVAAVSMTRGRGRGARSLAGLLVPGAGLYETHALLGVGLTVVAVALSVAWFRWGVDWAVAAVTIVSVVLSVSLDPGGSSTAKPLAAAHEFPLVALVLGAYAALASSWQSTRLGRWVGELRRRGQPAGAPPLDRCRAAALQALAGSSRPQPRGSASATSPGGAVPKPGIAEVVCAPPPGCGPASLDPALLAVLARRCRRIGIAARLRFGGDAFRVDHAHVRTALALTQRPLTSFVHDARRAPLGVPASEPGWVRLLDGTLAALALDTLGQPDAAAAWTAALDGPFGLRHGHRPAAWWTPLGLRGPRAAPWEHAAATALARHAGWLPTDDDWRTLRTRTLGAAARRAVTPADARLVAAGRLWLTLVDDPEAARILARPRVGHDPIAAALDDLARRPVAVRPVGPSTMHTQPSEHGSTP